MADVARTMLQATDGPLTAVLEMASATAARIVGFELPEGDEVELDDGLDVISTRVEGREVFRVPT